MIDRKRMPATGAAFVVALHGRLFVPLSGARATGEGFPKLLLDQFSAVAGISPHLLNLWAFDDRVARPRLVAGIAGPSDRPDRDWRLFRAAIEEFRALDARGYACLLDDVDRTVRGYVLSRPDQFRVTT